MDIIGIDFGGINHCELREKKFSRDNQVNLIVCMPAGECLSLKLGNKL